MWSRSPGGAWAACDGCILRGWLQVHYGAGAYICGEETALIESLEGERARARWPRHSTAARLHDARMGASPVHMALSMQHAYVCMEAYALPRPAEVSDRQRLVACVPAQASRASRASSRHSPPAWASTAAPPP